MRRSGGRWASYRDKKVTDCFQLLITKKEVEYDYVAVDATGLVATALRLAKNVTTEQRRQKEVARHVVQNLQQLLRKTRCKKSLLIALDGAESLAKAHFTRQSPITRKVESRLTRLPGTSLMQAVEERLVKMMPDRQILPSEVVLSGTCVFGCVEQKMTAWALDLACRPEFDGSRDSLCFVGASELYLNVIGATPYYNISSVVQNNADLRHVRMADLLEWLQLEKDAKAGDSTLVAGVRTDALFLYLLCNGCSSVELGGISGFSFPQLMDEYFKVFRIPEGRRNPVDREEGSYKAAENASMSDKDTDADGIARASVTTFCEHRFLFTDARGNALQMDVSYMCKVLRSAFPRDVSAKSDAIAASHLEHLLQAHTMLCLGYTPNPFFLPYGVMQRGGALSPSPTPVQLLAHLMALMNSGVESCVASGMSPSGAPTVTTATNLKESLEGNDPVESDFQVATGSAIQHDYTPYWSPTQPLTAAEYTLLSYSQPATVESSLLQYVGTTPKSDLPKQITQADITGAHALVQQALSFANPEKPHKCLCLSPSYCWLQNEKSKLWRMVYVDVGNRSHQSEVRRVSNAVSGVSVNFKASKDGPAVFLPASQTWSTALDFPCGAEGSLAPDRMTLKVLTWNVMFDRYSGQPTPLGMPGIDWCSSKRYPVLAKIIHQEDADVVGMQEVEPVFMEFLATQPWCRENYIVSCGASSPVLAPWGILMLIHRRRWPLLQLTHMNVPAWSGHISLMPVVSLKIRHGIVNVAATHLLAPYTKAHEHARTAQDDALRQRITKSIAGDCVVMGDFNDWPTSEFVMPTETRYVDCWPLLHPKNPGKTMDETNTFCKLKIEEMFFGRSDKIFLRSTQLRPREAHLVGTKSVNDENGNKDAPAYLFPSDHYGVSMTFTC